ncbi:hypothetical protein ACRAWD_01450 [Caulobacter segnis]
MTGCEALLRLAPSRSGAWSRRPTSFRSPRRSASIVAARASGCCGQACAEAAGWPEHVRLAREPVARPVPAIGAWCAPLSRPWPPRGLPARRLELEITESVLLAGQRRQHEHAARPARPWACASRWTTSARATRSLSYLRSFPFDKIKIDQTFVRDILDDSDAMAIIKAVPWTWARRWASSPRPRASRRWNR